MRPIFAVLASVLLAGPATAQPFILPLKPQRPAEAPAPAPSPAPVAPPQADAQPADPAKSSQAAGGTEGESAPRAPDR